MKSTLNFKVQYADTDAYQVAWHGSYLRWLEAGRMDWLYLNSINIKELDEKQGIVMPVVELKIRYSKSAKLLDDIEVQTDVIQKNPLFIIFEQKIFNKSGELLIKAEIKGVTVKNGKILKGFIDKIQEQ